MRAAPSDLHLTELWRILPKARDQWAFSSGVHYLNHGAFGATPDPVLQAFQNHQRRMELNPTEFFLEKKPQLLDHIRNLLAQELDADFGDLALLENATTAMNIVARSVPLQPDDEILLSTHEYGSVKKIWQNRAQTVGAKVCYFPMPSPWGDEEAILQSVSKQLTAKTRLLVFDHIVAGSGVVLPAQKLCAWARANDILTVIDGAHSAGQLDVSLESISADFYCGNLHKWFLAPKSAGFLHVNKAHHASLESTIVSWGWEERKSGKPFYTPLEIQGTKDISALLAVEAALEFQDEVGLRDIRDYCHLALEHFQASWTDLTKIPSLYSKHQAYRQMLALPLPEGKDALLIRNQLSRDFAVEVAAFELDSRTLVRISMQIYNSEDDLEAFRKGVEEVLGEGAS